jgi:predicted Na+-dependent transporter
MARALGWFNVVVGFLLLALVMSGVFSQVLTDISDWNEFSSIGAKVVVSVAGILAIASSIYLVLGQTRKRD